MEVEMGEAQRAERSPAELVREYERRTTGSETFYKHWGIIYTDGINFLAETCGAYWLIDAIVSHQPRVRRRLRAIGSRDFQVWRLRKMDSGAWALECWSDTPGAIGSGRSKDPLSKRLAYQRIPYSDFPEDLAPFECYLEEGTLMLKGER